MKKQWGILNESTKSFSLYYILDGYCGSIRELSMAYRDTSKAGVNSDGC